MMFYADENKFYEIYDDKTGEIVSYVKGIRKTLAMKDMIEAWTHKSYSWCEAVEQPKSNHPKRISTKG